MDFPCTSCGACCKTVGIVLANLDSAQEPWKAALEAFPYKADENGHCEKLENGKCSVYSTRPLICNVRKLYEEKFKDKMTLAEYYQDTIGRCHALMDNTGVPKNKRIQWPQQ